MLKSNIGNWMNCTLFPHILRCFIPHNLCPSCGKCCRKITKVPFAPLLASTPARFTRLLPPVSLTTTLGGTVAIECTNCVATLTSTSEETQVDELVRVLSKDYPGTKNPEHPYRCLCCDSTYTWKIIQDKLFYSIKQLQNQKEVSGPQVPNSNKKTPYTTL